MAQFPKCSVFLGQKSAFRRYCIQNVKDGIQIQVYNINNESVNHYSQFISVIQPYYFSRSKEKFKKISGVISGKVKKIEAQAK